MSQERTERPVDWKREYEKLSAEVKLAFDALHGNMEELKNREDRALESEESLKTEIDRLNATIAEQNEYIDAINKASDGLDTAVYLHMCHIEHLERVIVGQDSAVQEQAAKVQDRDAEIIRQRERIDRLDSELHKQNCRNQDQAEEIERLRAVGEDAAKIIENSGYHKTAASIRSALRAAEGTA